LRLAGRDLSVTYREFWPELAGEFRLSGREGVRTTIDHVLRKPWDGGEATLFDYTTNNGDRGQAVLFESAQLDLPRFTVHPGGFDLGSLGAAGAWVESRTRTGLVMLGSLAIVTADRVRVERLFTPEILAFFQLRQPGGRTWAEGGGRRLLYYKLSDAARATLYSHADLPADEGIGGFWAGAQEVLRLLAAAASGPRAGC
jgi:hypothetical protein